MRFYPAPVVVLFLLVAAAVATAESVPTDPAPAARIITVAGAADTLIVPDQAVWRIKLTGTDKDLQEAKKQTDLKLRAVASLCDDHDIGKGQREIGRIRMVRIYNRDKHGNQKGFKHYKVTRHVTVRQRDLNRFETFFEQLLAHAGSDISFSYESSIINQVRTDVRLRAMQTARRKAVAMVAAVDACLGLVMTISEFAPTAKRREVEALACQAGVVHRGDYDPEAIKLKLVVYVTFQIE